MMCHFLVTKTREKIIDETILNFKTMYLPEQKLTASQEKLLQSVPMYPKSHLQNSASTHAPWAEQLFTVVQVG